MNTAEMYIPDGQVKTLFDSIARQTRQSSAALVRDVMRLWCADLVRETYPKRQREGKERIEKDIDKMFRSIKTFDSEGIERRFKRGATFDFAAKTGERLFFRPAMTAETMGQEMNRGRMSRGRMPRNYRGQVFVVSRKAYSAFRRAKVASVGKLKAGWSAAALHFGISLPPFVRRHGAGQSSFQIFNDGTENMSLHATNSVPYADAKLGGPFMDFLIRKRVKDLEQGTYAKRWEKAMKRSLEKPTA